MRPDFSFRFPAIAALLALFMAAGFPLAGAAQTSATPAAPAQQDQAPTHTPPVTAKMNALAHRVLNAGIKLNALNAEGLPPWHLKLDFQMVQPGAPGTVPKPISGAMEEWSTGRYQWRRAYTSTLDRWSGSEWSVSLIQRYHSKPGPAGFQTALLNARVSRPVIDPLYQAANIRPDYEMDIKRVNTGGVVLNCVSVVDAARYVEDANPDWLFPTMCFDNDMHLRLTTASDTAVQYDDVQVFQGRAVARDVKVIVKGSLIAEMKVSVLEPMTGDAASVAPPANALPEPFIVEPGQPHPESVYEVAASIPIAPTGFPYRGTFPMPVLIRKDGSVKPNPDQITFRPTEISDAIEVALAKWKYKPYLIDGQPVEVQFTVPYEIDGKPFVPSYERPRPAKVVTSPEDFTSAYDPRRDPAKDLLMAEAQAKAGNKRILLDVGGDWCYWCKALDKFFADHKDLRDLRDQYYVVMKVNMSSLNENYAFLSQYPKIPGYPWIFVLDADGNLVKSENTDFLEDGARGYSARAIQEFLAGNKPPPTLATAQ